ncbi:low molecular weight protein arginine phosphatase [Bacillus tianshenii]|uniref:low molecular weight protein arginine phosphatase n=1 Tax=Sutcliffiella tianshenii TaxID=1463404 RepID=UPI001CD27341|nr:low molecular weight protein arginine phosphatase [Bacillus tianshenii]MCA1320299.1 low molecular weight protein arginine phosphatase [Bacillus tianshenii]
MNILFVCTGNTCRSPMAEAILASKKLKDVQVRSAGVFAMPGSLASYQAQEVLKEKGIPSSHASSMVTEKSIDWADYILTMTTQHRVLVEERFPKALGKTFSLKEFVGKDGEVSDPFGGSVHTYRNTFEELQDLIELVIKKII